MLYSVYVILYMLYVLCMHACMYIICPKCTGRLGEKAAPSSAVAGEGVWAGGGGGAWLQGHWPEDSLSAVDRKMLGLSGYELQLWRCFAWMILGTRVFNMF